MMILHRVGVSRTEHPTIADASIMARSMECPAFSYIWAHWEYTNGCVYLSIFSSPLKSWMYLDGGSKSVAFASVAANINNRNNGSLILLSYGRISLRHFLIKSLHAFRYFEVSTIKPSVIPLSNFDVEIISVYLSLPST